VTRRAQAHGTTVAFDTLMQHVESEWAPSQDQTFDEHGPVVPRNDAVRRAWKHFRLAHGRRPIIGALIIGGAALALAANIGGIELAVGALTAYAAYRMLRYGVDLRQALAETVEVEQLARKEVEGD